MFETYFFALGLANNILLIIVFLLRLTNNLPIVESYGWIYLLLGLPASALLLMKKPQKQAKRFAVFLWIFLMYLVIEGVFEYILKTPFRENWLLLSPYLILYYAMNYGFAVMTWKTSSKKGILITCLFAVQVLLNVFSHLA